MPSPAAADALGPGGEPHRRRLPILWHLPLFGVEYNFQNGVPWALVTLAGSVIRTWVFNNAAGSALMAMLFHAVLNTFAGSFFFPMFSGPDQLRLWWLNALVWWTVAIAVILVAGPARLTRRPAPDPAAVSAPG